MKARLPQGMGGGPQNMQNMRLNLQKQKIQNLPMAQPPKMKIKPTVLQPLLKIGMQC